MAKRAGVTSVWNLTKEELERKNTKRLLNIKKKLMPYSSLSWYEDWVWNCDCEDCVAIRKQMDKAIAQIDIIKEVLTSREHIKREGKR
jgi:hypothetical protein